MYEGGPEIKGDCMASSVNASNSRIFFHEETLEEKRLRNQAQNHRRRSGGKSSGSSDNGDANVSARVPRETTAMCRLPCL